MGNAVERIMYIRPGNYVPMPPSEDRMTGMTISWKPDGNWDDDWLIRYHNEYHRVHAERRARG